MKKRLCVVLLIFWLRATASAQTTGFEGTWYGTIAPPGVQFSVAINFQKRVDAWAGTLLLEDGNSVPLSKITVAGDSIVFFVEAGRGEVEFKGKLAGAPAEFVGELKQDGSAFPFTLTRNPAGGLTGAGIAIDPDELMDEMTSFSGGMSDRPFVPPLTHAAIGYGVRPAAADPVAKLQKDIQDGTVQLKFEGEDGYLLSVLDALHIPPESQMAVFSKNSLQGQIISPENPRLIFFNDAVSVASVRGGFIEIASQDSEQGMNFYMMAQQPSPKPFIISRTDCLRCHHSRNSLDIPGMLLRSVYPSPGGVPVNPLGSFLLDHRTKFEERWGGWYVTGSSGAMKHMGNAIVSNPANPDPMTAVEAHVSSDIVALMVFEHQMHLMNLITRAGWEFRVAKSLTDATGRRNDKLERQLADAVNEFVDYLLFIDERPLSGKIQGSSGFAEKFAALGPVDSKGRSLRQFDLEKRLMRYPCSYMIYSPAFDALPAEAKKAIYERMLEVMSSRMTREDRQAVIEILRDTKKDLPENFK